MWQPFHAEPDYYADRAEGLLAGARDGTPTALALFAGRPLDTDGARAVVAAQHGCADWSALIARLDSLGTEPFARAYRALEAHDPDALSAELEAHPEIVRQAGTNGNDLLGMAAGTCDERTVGRLLEAGADPSHPNAHGWTPLHQAAYSNLPHLATLLLDAGADPGAYGRGDGGTPLVAALFWGNRAVTEVLLRAGPLPRNLRVAAGIGDAELVTALIGTPDAGAHRGFYRPHSGFPEWQPSDDPQEVLDEALCWAARNDRPVAALVDAGASLDADVYRGTALAWAAAVGATTAMRELLSLGADVNGRTSFGGEAEGVTPLGVAEHSGQAEAAALLRAAGAGRVA